MTKNVPPAVARRLLLESGHRCAICGGRLPLNGAKITPYTGQTSPDPQDCVCLCAGCETRVLADEMREERLRQAKAQPRVRTLALAAGAVSTTSQVVQLAVDASSQLADVELQAWLESAVAAFLDLPRDGVRVATIVRTDGVTATIESSSAAVERLLFAIRSRDKDLDDLLDPLKLVEREMGPEEHDEVTREERRPGRQTRTGRERIPFEKLAVTQFVSALFFAAAFFTCAANYKADKVGFGAIRKEVFILLRDKVRESEDKVISDDTVISIFTYIIFYGIIATNAGRYYLSFWSVEEREAFHVITRWARESPKTRLHVAIRSEWGLRFISLIGLYLVQTTCQVTGRHVEVLLVAFFFLLLLWDLLMVWLICQYKDSQLRCSATIGVLESDIWFWLKLEGIGLTVAISYQVMTALSGDSFWLTILSVPGLAVAMAAIMLVDFWRNWQYYRRILPWLVAGSVGVGYLMKYLVYG